MASIKISELNWNCTNLAYWRESTPSTTKYPAKDDWVECRGRHRMRSTQVVVQVGEKWKVKSNLSGHCIFLYFSELFLLPILWPTTGLVNYRHFLIIVLCVLSRQKRCSSSCQQWKLFVRCRWKFINKLLPHPKVFLNLQILLARDVLSFPLGPINVWTENFKSNSVSLRCT